MFFFVADGDTGAACGADRRLSSAALASEPGFHHAADMLALWITSAASAHGSADATNDAALSAGPRLRVADVPDLPPRRDEVRVGVRLAGICRTDLELVRGYAGFDGIPGHEFVGTVLDPDSPLQGRRVVGEINVGCGCCPLCHASQERHCPARTVLGIVGRAGAFAQALSLPSRNLLPVPDGVSDEQAVFCEPLAAALALFEGQHIAPGTQVLVIGDGKLGLLVAQVAAHMGAKTTLLGRHTRKLQHAARWGVDALQSENSATGGPRFPVVVECSGTPLGLTQALQHTAPRGTLLLKSTYAPMQEPQLDWARVVVDEIRVQGSRCGRFAPALQLLSRRAIEVDCLVDGCLPLSQGVAAFAQASERGALKVLLRPDNLSAG